MRLQIMSILVLVLANISMAQTGDFYLHQHASHWSKEFHVKRNTQIGKKHLATYQALKKMGYIDVFSKSQSPETLLLTESSLQTTLAISSNLHVRDLSQKLIETELGLFAAITIESQSIVIFASGFSKFRFRNLMNQLQKKLKHRNQYSVFQHYFFRSFVTPAYAIDDTGTSRAQKLTATVSMTPSAELAKQCGSAASQGLLELPRKFNETVGGTLDYLLLRPFRTLRMQGVANALDPQEFMQRRLENISYLASVLKKYGKKVVSGAMRIPSQARKLYDGAPKDTNEAIKQLEDLGERIRQWSLRGWDGKTKELCYKLAQTALSAGAIGGGLRALKAGKELSNLSAVGSEGVGKGKSVVFVSDLHIGQNGLAVGPQGLSLRSLQRKIAAATGNSGAKKVVYVGDVFHGPWIHNVMKLSPKEAARQYANVLSKTTPGGLKNAYLVTGNHELRIGGAAAKQWNDAFLKELGKKVNLLTKSPSEVAKVNGIAVSHYPPTIQGRRAASAHRYHVHGHNHKYGLSHPVSPGTTQIGTREIGNVIAIRPNRGRLTVVYE